MKYLCLGYLDENKINTMSERERETFLKECSAYDNILRTNGHFVRLEGLERAQNAKTVRSRNGKVMVTDGPYAETKEQIGGLLLLEAKDLNHARPIDVEASGHSRGCVRDPCDRRTVLRQASEVGNP